MDNEQLADDVLDYLNGYFGINGTTDMVEEPLITFVAEKPETREQVLVEQTDFRVLVLPSSTTETKINRAGKTLEHPVVSIAVVGPIANVTRALAIRFVDQIKRSLRTTVFDGYHWRNNTTSTVWNPESAGVQQFQSVFQAEYTGIA